MTEPRVYSMDDAKALGEPFAARRGAAELFSHRRAFRELFRVGQFDPPAIGG